MLVLMRMLIVVSESPRSRESTSTFGRSYKKQKNKSGYQERGYAIEWTGMYELKMSTSPSQTERQCLEHAELNENTLRKYIVYHNTSDVDASKRAWVAYRGRT